MLKLLQLENSHIDIFVSHEWPSAATAFGDCASLIKTKPYFAKEIQQGELGSHNLSELMEVLKPKHWLSAHLHVEFETMVDFYTHQVHF